ncbi:NAD/FAD-dependent oxidoreductase, partial [Xanthomonas hortorum pv. gardneri]
CAATADEVSADVCKTVAALGVTVPQACAASRWAVASGEPPLQSGCAWDAQLRIGLCGDWLAGGKVEGAWQSGVALAERVRASDTACSGHD